MLFISFAARSPSSLSWSLWNFTTWSLSWCALLSKSKNSGLSPIKVWGQKYAKFGAILHNLQLWSRISQERVKISKIGQRHVIENNNIPPTFGEKEVRWILSHWNSESRTCEFGPPKSTFSGHHISAPRGCSVLKFLHALEIHQRLLGHTTNLVGVPKKF